MKNRLFRDSCDSPQPDDGPSPQVGNAQPLSGAGPQSYDDDMQEDQSGVPRERPRPLDQLIADGVVTPPLDVECTPLPKRIEPTGPVSPLIIEDRR